MRRLAFTFLVVACHREPPPSVHREPDAVIDASAPPVVSAASIAIAEPAPPPAPAGCRHAIAPGADFAHVPDVALRELILSGAPGPKKAKDCLGHTVEYSNPMPARVERYDVSATHMAVFIPLAKELGYMEWSPGVAAIVRLDHDEIVTEGVGPESLDDSSMTSTPHLATVEGHRVLLFPHVTSTGEDGDFEAAWSVSVADDHGALETVGSITNTRSMGNGSIMTGAWFDAMTATVAGTSDLSIEESWQRVRYDDGGSEVHGAKRKVVRTYALRNGKLVAQ